MELKHIKQQDMSPLKQYFRNKHLCVYLIVINYVINQMIIIAKQKEKRRIPTPKRLLYLSYNLSRAR